MNKKMFLELNRCQGTVLASCCAVFALGTVGGGLGPGSPSPSPCPLPPFPPFPPLPPLPRPFPEPFPASGSGSAGFEAGFPGWPCLGMCRYYPDLSTLYNIIRLNSHRANHIQQLYVQSIWGLHINIAAWEDPSAPCESTLVLLACSSSSIFEVLSQHRYIRTDAMSGLASNSLSSS